METITTKPQDLERNITWNEIIERVSKLDKAKKYYGVPRGGAYISAMLNPVETPEQADIIIDDLIDSGSTEKQYAKYNKPFIGLFNKQTESGLNNVWLKFPWEKEEEPVEYNVVRIFQYLGEDPNREGLKDTPKRYLKFLKEFLAPKDFNFTCFDAEGTDEMIIQTNIPFYSLCEHHIAPFFGVANVAYVPNDKIVGLSKLARTVDLYANRFQNQERITTQIAERLQKELSPQGVAVTMNAQHLCMCMRGVKKHDTWTMTSKMTGIFKDDLNCRNEFLNLIKK
jgi:GTP cyclohydrolase I